MKKIKSLFTLIIVSLPAFLGFAGCATQSAGDGDTSGTTGGSSFGNFISQWGWIILLGALVLLWFFYSASRRKKQVKEGQNMLESIRPGTYIMTQGGVIGKVVEVIVISPTEKHVVLETGGEEHKSYITYDIRAVGVILRPEQLVPRAPAEEIVMPSDEEIKSRLNEVYTAPAEGGPANETGEAAAQDTAAESLPGNEGNSNSGENNGAGGNGGDNNLPF